MKYWEFKPGTYTLYTVKQEMIMFTYIVAWIFFYQNIYWQISLKCYLLCPEWASKSYRCFKYVRTSENTEDINNLDKMIMMKIKIIKIMIITMLTWHG